jgi:RNA polymerase sigma-70 factor (ECF subfamily)
VSEPARNSLAPAPRPAARMGLRAIFEAYYPTICRLLHRLGVRPAQVDDSAQEVFWVAARRLSDIDPGREHAFLYGVALRVAASEVRRQSAVMPTASLDEIPLLPDEQPSAEEQLADRQARALLDEALDRLPLDLRAVLVLHEIEGLEVKQIAEIESVPIGTASSRLRRAREEFSAIARRMRARLQSRGGCA